MSYMNELEIEIREMLENNMEEIGFENCIKDLAVLYGTSYEQMSLLVEKLMSSQTDGGMTFADDYTRKRFEGR